MLVLARPSPVAVLHTSGPASAFAVTAPAIYAAPRLARTSRGFDSRHLHEDSPLGPLRDRPECVVERHARACTVHRIRGNLRAWTTSPASATRSGPSRSAIRSPSAVLLATEWSG